jgi:hypothetical protein
MLFKIRLLVFVLIVIGLSSCEYKLDKENFRDIDKPSDIHRFDLNLAGEKDTIEIFRETEFSCNFNLYGLNILKAEFSLQGKTWNIYSEIAKFSINPQQFSPGYDTLTLVLYTNSGTGSMADIAETEGYKVVRKWLVLLDGRPAPIITLTQSITPEGYLKISWPKCEQFNFQHYSLNSVVFITGFSKTITNADSTFYIDSCYIGGEANYRVDSKVKDNPEQGYGNTLYLNDPYPTLKFAEAGIDSLRIYWDKSKYKATYRLIRGDIDQYSPIFESKSDTSFKILSPGLGYSANFTLTTLPFKPNSSNTSYNHQNFKYYSLGQPIETNWPEYAYNRIEKVVYTSSYDDVHCYDVGSVTLTKSYNITNLLYQKEYACPTNSTKVAALSPYNIYVFADRNLQNPVIIPYSSWGIDIYHFYMTDNDIIAIATQTEYQQIRISDSKVIASINLTENTVINYISGITTSRDGKYVCVVTNNGLRIYSVINSVVKTIHSDIKIYRSAIFDDKTDSRLLLTTNTPPALEVRDAANFSLIKTIDLPTKAIIQNIDPESGYLLLTDYQYATILDVENSKPKLKILSTDSKPNLFNSRLFTKNGFTLDISKFLVK